MAAGLTMRAERRRGRRQRPEDVGCARIALLRPGRDVEVLNLGTHGALLQCAARVKPGSRGELQLAGRVKRAVCGRIDRARVVRLEPLRFEAAFVFDEAVVWPGSG
jgi:hypothetical protein